MGVRERVFRVQLLPNPDASVDADQLPPYHLLEELTNVLRGAFDQLLDRPDIADRDQIYFQLGSDRLDHVYDGWGLHAFEWRHGTPRVSRILENLAKLLNSNDQFQIDDSFTLAVVHVQGPPQGGGGKRRHTPGHQSHNKLTKEKTSVIKIPPNTNNMCCAHALVVARAHVTLSIKQFNDHYNKKGRPTSRKVVREYMELQDQAQICIGTLCGPAELEKFAQVLPEFTIVIADADRCYERYRYGSGETLLGLSYSEGHYDVITSLAGFFNRSYFCGLCLSAYSNEGHHACTNNQDHCPRCFKTGCPDFLTTRQHYFKTPTLDCPHCGLSFFGHECQLYHTTHTRAGKPATDIASSVCATVRRCPKCCTIIYHRTRDRHGHQCYHAKCPSCHEYLNLRTHRCYIQTDGQIQAKKRRDRERRRQRQANAATNDTSEVEEQNETNGVEVEEGEDETLLVFFDIESMQVTDEHGAITHQPNLLIAETDQSDEPEIFDGSDCVTKFIDWLDKEVAHTDDDHPTPVTVLAHNFQGYDSYPIIDAYHQQKRILEQQRNGGKVLCLKVGSIRFIDSMSFLPMALADFEKTFELTELKKGFFPHFFNTPDNQDYIGPLPPKNMYGPHTMSIKRRKKFDRWYDAHPSDYVFNFEDELLEYCHSHVRLLKEGCLRFRDEFLSMAHFDPFSKNTIASACMWDLRKNRLQEGTIASEAVTGWRRHTNHSKVAMEWLAWEEHQLGRELQHARSAEGEYEVPDTSYSVDGYDVTTNTIYEFYGCYWHGCTKCHRQRTERHQRLINRNLEDVYRATMKRQRDLEALGYNLKVMWECKWTKQKETCENIESFVSSLDIQPPLCPRDAFFGGRTNAVCLYAEATTDRPIMYYDYTSLYPYINKNKLYPIDHPLIVYNPEDQNLSSYFGIACCTILPPARLYHPVLPYRYGNKLTFPLCRSCVETQLDLPLTTRAYHCSHTPQERALTGTWCTPELEKAVEKGYTVQKIHEVWHFKNRKDDLFRKYVDTWLRLKEEASGFPANCTTPEQRQQHCEDYEAHEGIELDIDNINHNPGKRTVAKLMLNSMWGKFGQRTDRTQLREFTRAQEMHEFLASAKYDIRYVSPITAERVEVHHKLRDHMEDVSPNLNIFVACFTTCWARLRLYEALDLLQDRVLYFDTDSIIFWADPHKPSPSLGNYLGDFKNELDPGEYITEFCSGGPKNYGYRTSNGTTVCKVRGFSLNCEGSAQLNYELMKQNIIAEVQDPEPKPRTTRVTESTKIVRLPKTYTLTTQARYKDYRLVFNKRVLDISDFKSYPYGYDQH